VPHAAGAAFTLQRKCKCGSHAPGGGLCLTCQRKQDAGVRPRLEAVNADDIHEREADRVADQIVSAKATVETAPEAKMATPRIQRFTGHPNAQTGVESASVDRALADPGRPLEPGIRQEMEQHFSHDFSRLRVYTGPGAAASARDMDAKAYAIGRNIVFGEGQFALHTHEGRHLLAHELTHVVQQQGGNASMQREPAVDSRWKQDTQAAKYRGQLMAKRIRAHTKLSKEARAKINRELAYFEGAAKDAYIHEIKPVLASVVEIEMPAESAAPEAEKETPEISCDFGQDSLTYEGHPEKDRCLPADDPEFRKDYVDNGMVLATGITIPGTTWGNITDARVPIMRLTYGDKRQVDIKVSDVPLSGGEASRNPRTINAMKIHTQYEKRMDGFIYPIRGRGKSKYVSYGDASNIMSLRAGLHQTIAELQTGFTLVQATAGFAANIAALGSIAALNHTFNTGGLFEPVGSRKGGGVGVDEETGVSSKGGNSGDSEQGTSSSATKTPASSNEETTGGSHQDEGAPAGQQQKPTTQREQDEEAAAAQQKVANKNDEKDTPDPAEDNKQAGSGSSRRDRSAKDFEDLEPEGEGKPKKRKSRDADDGDAEKDETISDSRAKQELENSAWLRRRLPNAKDRRLFMEFLEEGHGGAGHAHLNPDSRAANRILEHWASGIRGLSLRR
jgi:hypothetical protein